MNHLNKLLILALGMLPFLPLNGQITDNNIFKIYELELLQKDANAPAVENLGIVDINALLVARLEKDAIAKAIQRYAGSSEADLMEKIEQLEMLLRNQVAIMEGFQTDAGRANFEGLNQLAELMVPFLEEVEENATWRRMYNEFSAQYDVEYPRSVRRAAEPGSIPFRDEYIINQFANKITELSQAIATGIPRDSIKFLMYGSIQSRRGGAPRPIKLSDDLDTFEPDIYVVPRWQTSLTEGNIASMLAIDSLSNQLHQLTQVQGKDIKSWLQRSFSAQDCLQDVVAQLEALPSNLSSIASTTLDQVKAKVAVPLDEAKGLSSQYTSNLALAPGVSNVDMLYGLSANMNSTITNIGNLLASLDDDLLVMLGELPASPEVTSFMATYGSCRANLEADKATLTELSRRFAPLLKNNKKASQASIGIGDEVRRLGFDEIPGETEIDLTYAGARDNGDKITIETVLERSIAGHVDRRTIGKQYFTVQQIGLHSVLKPMLLMADPTSGSSDNVKLPKRYQFAPAYTMLFQWGSRKNKWLNTLTPSLGVNFAAPDFNLDGVPEFGAAAEFSFFKDYLSTGFGYNFGADASYHFIGFRLPIGTLPLPMFNDVEIK